MAGGETYYDDSSSIKKEIAAHRADEPENAWLSRVGFIDSPDDDYHIDQVHEWKMLGSECYVMDFRVITQQKVTHAIAKACIKVPATLAVNDWMDRRARLEQYKMSVPKLFSRMGASYIEEYIPLELKTAVESSDDPGILAKTFIDTYIAVRQAGFRPVSLHDVRSHGNDTVLIDFGSDLGGYREGPEIGSQLQLEEEARNEIRKILR